jgi:hypothetical protein
MEDIYILRCRNSLSTLRFASPIQQAESLTALSMGYAIDNCGARAIPRTFDAALDIYQ